MKAYNLQTNHTLMETNNNDNILKMGQMGDIYVMGHHMRTIEVHYQNCFKVVICFIKHRLVTFD